MSQCAFVDVQPGRHLLQYILFCSVHFPQVHCSMQSNVSTISIAVGLSREQLNELVFFPLHRKRCKLYALIFSWYDVIICLDLQSLVVVA